MSNIADWAKSITQNHPHDNMKVGCVYDPHRVAYLFWAEPKFRDVETVKYSWTVPLQDTSKVLGYTYDGSPIYGAMFNTRSQFDDFVIKHLKTAEKNFKIGGLI